MDYEILGRHGRLAKDLKKLSDAGHRAETGLFAVEGVRVTGELLSSPLQAEYIVISENLDTAEPELYASLKNYGRLHPGTKILSAADSLMQDISSAKTSQGIFAAVRLPSFSTEDILKADRILVLSQIQDPGNTGTLIRSGLAFGFQAVLACGGADPFNSRAVRSAAGAVFHLPVLRCADSEIQSWSSRLADNGYTLATAEAHGGSSLRGITSPARTALVLGAEVKGVDICWQSEASLKVHIPLFPQSESLNVAAAGAVIMYEFSKSWPMPRS